MRYAFDENIAARRDCRDFAVPHRLIHGQERISIVADALDFWDSLADETGRFVVGVLVEEARELAMCGEGWLDGDDYVG
jgi:hypothetical protein